MSASFFMHCPVIGGTKQALHARILTHARIMWDYVVGREVRHTTTMAQAEIVVGGTILRNVCLFVLLGQSRHGKKGKRRDDRECGESD